MKKWIVSVRVVLTEKYEVEAETVEEASEKYLNGLVSDAVRIESTTVEDVVEEVSLMMGEVDR